MNNNTELGPPLGERNQAPETSMKTTEIIQKPGLGVTLVGDDLIINAGELSHSITVEYLQRKLDKHVHTQDFPSFVNSTGLSEKDKDLIKGVFYDWVTS